LHQIFLKGIYVKKNIIFIIIILTIFGLSSLINLSQTKDNPTDAIIMNLIQLNIETIKNLNITYPILSPILFSLLFFILTVAYIPFIGPVFVLCSGALYGPILGAVLFSFVVSLSYTASFLISRQLYLKYKKNKKKNSKLQKIIHGFEKDGWLYLLSVRFAGVIPAIAINIGMGLTSIPAWQFYIVTQIGTFPIILVYSFAGSKIENLKSLNDFISPYFLLFMIFLSICPILIKIISDYAIVKLKKRSKKA
jgi:uncharacterized membrane protein YdjX (TVP38/TMEM64 family)